ncbi:nodulation S family protein, partial [Mycobacterium parascrofulaceum]
MYAGTDDPWALSSRWYEQRKYAITLALLPARRYRHAFEPGCSIGTLTARLARRCDQV